MWVRGDSRSLELVLFESTQERRRLGVVSYSPSIVTMAVSVVVRYSVSKNCVILKTMLGVVQSH